MEKPGKRSTTVSKGRILSKEWRWWFLIHLTLAIALVLVVLAIVQLPVPDTALDQAARQQFARIRPGMTRADVIEILGPPRDLANRPAKPPDWPEVLPNHTLEWDSDHLRFFVYFDTRDSSAASTGNGLIWCHEDESVLAKILRYVRR